MSFQVNIEALSKKNGQLKTIVKTPNYNVCDVFRDAKKKENSLLNMITKQLIDSVRPPVTNCPLRKGKVLLTNFHLDGSKIPSVIPSGLYYIYFHVLTIEDGVKVHVIKPGFDIKIKRI